MLTYFLSILTWIPQNSPFYDICDYDNGITMLERRLFGIVEKNEDASFILCGDFNARTGNKVPTYFDFASSCFNMTGGNFWLDGFKNNDPPFQRRSKDTHINVNGHNLLALCSSFDLYILNGICKGDTSGPYNTLTIHLYFSQQRYWLFCIFSFTVFFVT